MGEKVRICDIHSLIHICTRGNRNIIHFKTYLVTKNQLNFFFASFIVTILNQSFYWLCAIVIVKLTVLIEVPPFFPYFRFNQIFYSLFSFLLFYCELKDPIIWLDFYISIIPTVQISCLFPIDIWKWDHSMGR